MRPIPMSFFFGSFLCLAIMSYGIPSDAAVYSADDHRLPEQGGYCPVGQVWPGYDPDWIEPASITGAGETFFALFDPDENCACPIGFRVTTIDFFMALAKDSPLPITITVSMGLTEAVPDPGGPIPWLPGATLCETPVRDFTLYIPKLYVGFGIALECECAAMDRPYFLFFTIHSVMDPPGGFYTAGGGAPEPGRYLTFVDDEWVDMVAAGILTRGGLVVSGSAQCCETPVAVGEPDESLPAVTRLNGASPNPFNPQTTISFSLERAGWAEIIIYALTGRRVATLAEGTFSAGTHSVTWNGRDGQGRAMPSGTYIIRLETETGVQASKAVLVR